jgi:hypothetical protein
MAKKPEYRELLRSLAILRCLQIELANKPRLVDYVRAEVGRDTYDEETKRAAKQFAKDIERLRAWGIEILVETGHEYHLVSYGDFSPICLSETELGAMAFLGRKRLHQAHPKRTRCNSFCAALSTILVHYRPANDGLIAKRSIARSPARAIP